MSCCLYRVILEERPSVRVLASAVDDELPSPLFCFRMDAEVIRTAKSVEYK